MLCLHIFRQTSKFPISSFITTKKSENQSHSNCPLPSTFRLIINYVKSTSIRYQLIRYNASQTRLSREKVPILTSHPVSHLLKTLLLQPWCEISWSVPLSNFSHVLQGLVTSVNKFAVATADIFFGITDIQSNVLESPFNIYEALVLLWRGTRGNSRKQLASALRLNPKADEKWVSAAVWLSAMLDIQQ